MSSQDDRTPAPSRPPRTVADARLRAHLAFLGELPAHGRRLRATDGAGPLFAETAALVREECGFDRALVLTVVGGGVLTVTGSDALSDPDSDDLRRRVLAKPIPVAPRTHERDLIRGTTPRTLPRHPRTSHVAELLDLEDPLLAPIAPDGRTLALLVADRPRRPGDVLDQAAVLAVAVMAGVALEHVVVKARMDEMFAAFKYLASSTQAVMAEVLQAPVAIPSAGDSGYAFVQADALPVGADSRRLLTEREEQVAALLVEGRSNREIAERLIISPETVKDCVVRLRRKLHAANRVEAASRYLELVRSR
jgi:DNA-binding CsgD family transcriptional regulator